MTRRIIHLDLDAFFCSVEELDNPLLKIQPFAVGGKPEERGVVASCSYPARRFGVRSAMPMHKAIRICPGLHIVPPHHQRYKEFSVKIMNEIHTVSPLVEQVSIDEAFIDVSDVADEPATIAKMLQARINHSFGLPCSLGVASNKLVSKIANDFGKMNTQGSGPPNSITVVPPGKECIFLSPLPVEALWGIGPKLAAKLSETGIYTIGELANQPVVELIQRFGKTGYEMSQRAKGIDDTPIKCEHQIKSISQEVTFTHDQRDDQFLEKTLHQLSEQVGQRLRSERMLSSTIKIKIRWPNFTTITRQESLVAPIDQDIVIYETALSLFHKVWQSGKPIRLIGVGVSRLQSHPQQLVLWENNQSHIADSIKTHILQSTIEGLQERFGNHIIYFGNKMRKE
jgi:DNA polymerase IV